MPLLRHDSLTLRRHSLHSPFPHLCNSRRSNNSLTSVLRVRCEFWYFRVSPQQKGFEINHTTKLRRSGEQESSHHHERTSSGYSSSRFANPQHFPSIGRCDHEKCRHPTLSSSRHGDGRNGDVTSNRNTGSVSYAIRDGATANHGSPTQAEGDDSGDGTTIRCDPAKQRRA